MKERSCHICISVLLVSVILILFSGCETSVDPIKYHSGTYPDTVYNLGGINSQYDDYNSNVYVIGNTFGIIFSSNRNSSGGQFDLVQGSVTYQFDQTTGAFSVTSSMTNEALFSVLITKANTAGNDFGPYSLYSSTDGYEYLLLASQNAGGPLDIHYLKYHPQFGSAIPEVSGPFPANLLNTASDEAYISFDTKEDSAYFSSNRGGDWDIFVHTRPVSKSVDTWLTQSFESSVAVDSLNSTGDEKCPYVYGDLMLFASNRPGGMGGYDLYYSRFMKGKWGSPVNLGPGINTAGDEYRPLISGQNNFTNLFMIFSSNKSGGKGGFDLYFSGLTIAR